MKLYKIERIEDVKYYQHDSFVVAAMSHPAARRIIVVETDPKYEQCDWMLVKDASCRLIADSTPEPEGIVVSSYNAG